MGVHIAGGEGGGGHEEPVAALVALARAEQVVEPPDLAAAGHPEALSRQEQLHRPVEQAFVKLQLHGLARPFLLRWRGAHQDQPIGPLGGTGERMILPLKPEAKLR